MLQVALGTYYQLHQIINQLDTRKLAIKTNLLYLFVYDIFRPSRDFQDMYQTHETCRR